MYFEPDINDNKSVPYLIALFAVSKSVTADHTVEYSAGRIFNQDNIQDNIRHLYCKSSPGIGIFKRIASKSKFDIPIGTK